ncbi:MAG: metallophosphatase family protein [Deltaproteobacteria bacterium]|nr:metallophosphatase family protein [Deltaproteobacteria bacterium]
MEKGYKIGLISDTHGLLSEEAVYFLKDADLILHAGDIGSLEVLERLKELAPLTAVRGNCDSCHWAENLPETDMVEIGGHAFYLIHDLEMLDLDPKTAEISCVVSGHTHEAMSFSRDGVLYVNPGSAGPERYGKTASIACLEIGDGKIKIRLEKI